MVAILYVALAIVILLVMVIIHEFGHYLAAKLFKFKINEFSVGFGPKLFQKKKKNGELFTLRLIPLGGYCAFEDESGDNLSSLKTDKNVSVSQDPFVDENVAQIEANISEQTVQNIEQNRSTSGKSFMQEKPYKRIIVLLAGGVFNLISAVLFSFIFILAVGYSTPTVTKVFQTNEGQPYTMLQENDQIVAVDGKKITIMHSFEEMTASVSLGDKITVTVVRDGKTLLVPLTAQNIVTDKDKYVGFGFTQTQTHVNKGVGYALTYCVPFTGKMAVSILGSFWGLITGQIPLTSLTGPVGTVGMMASISQQNWRNILVLLPLIAANLGIFNLLPIPALDGSKVVFTAVEWMRGKPINQKVENYIHSIGMIALLLFVVVIDIVGMVLR